MILIFKKRVYNFLLDDFNGCYHALYIHLKTAEFIFILNSEMLVIMKAKITQRKGAKKLQDIPREVLDLLNKGEIEAVNLTEWLAVDHIELLQNNFKDLGLSETVVQIIKEKIAIEKKPTAMRSIKLIGVSLYEYYANHKDYPLVLNGLRTHLSDSIRCYAPYLIGMNDQLSIEEKLNESKTLVSDKHFGVREVVWMALRPAIETDLEISIHFLSKWAVEKDENLRRFTTEATRPRGVWCKHIEALKEQPQLALSILEQLKSDASKYVQDSVGNWLNDASKTQAGFVIDLCEQWQEESPTKETAKIIKRARRTIDKP